MFYHYGNTNAFSLVDCHYSLFLIWSLPFVCQENLSQDVRLCQSLIQTGFLAKHIYVYYDSHLLDTKHLYG